MGAVLGQFRWRVNYRSIVQGNEGEVAWLSMETIRLLGGREAAAHVVEPVDEIAEKMLGLAHPPPGVGAVK